MFQHGLCSRLNVFIPVWLLPKFPAPWSNPPTFNLRSQLRGSALEINRIGAWRNADGFEFAPRAVITDTARCALTGNKMQFPAPVAYDPISQWHPAIMLRDGDRQDW